MAGTGLYSKLTTDAQQERALLSAIGFTGGFAACRGVTHAIRRGIPPFHNLSSKGGTHIHHSTFGIFGLLGIGFLWAQQVFTGHDEPPRWGSRITATTYGISSALTLDEFALWLDLHDDYWVRRRRDPFRRTALDRLGRVRGSGEGRLDAEGHPRPRQAGHPAQAAVAAEDR
jgi:hypothetical protein